MRAAYAMLLLFSRTLAGGAASCDNSRQQNLPFKCEPSTDYGCSVTGCKLMVNTRGHNFGELEWTAQKGTNMATYFCQIRHINTSFSYTSRWITDGNEVLKNCTDQDNKKDYAVCAVDRPASAEERMRCDVAVSKNDNVTYSSSSETIYLVESVRKGTTKDKLPSVKPKEDLGGETTERGDIQADKENRSPKDESPSTKPKEEGRTQVGRETTKHYDGQTVWPQTTKHALEDRNTDKEAVPDKGNSPSDWTVTAYVGVAVTVVANTVIFLLYCRRRELLCWKNTAEGNAENERRNEARTGGEPMYSMPQKWLTRPSRKVPRVTYTGLDLPSSKPWTPRRPETPYAEIVGVAKPLNIDYAEINLSPHYATIPQTNHREYMNTDQINGVRHLDCTYLNADEVGTVAAPEKSEKRTYCNSDEIVHLEVPINHCI